MAMVTLKSPCKANLSQTFTCENNNHRVASFSSYLSGNEEAFVRKLADQSTEQQHKNNHLGAKKEEQEEEIGVFGAEKYFNGVMDEETTSPKSASSSKKYHHNKEKRVSPDHMKKIKVQHGTPSVRSESSWNSQSALLQSGLRNPCRSNTSKGQRQKNFFASLGCKCSCLDKNSVDVDEHVGEISFKKSNGANSGALIHGKASTTSPINNKPASVVDLVSEALVEMKNNQKLDKLGVGLSRENCFTFPTPKSGAGSLPVKISFQEEEAEKVRKSLEVFGSPVFQKRNKSLVLEKRLTMLPWDEFRGNSGGAIYNNESDSDASSDLFEIESLTGKANPFFARQASDAATSGCVSPTNCYAPSEASIEWSVVTASVNDFSMMSDFEDHQQKRSPMKMAPHANGKTRMNKEIPRHRPTALLGCKSQKAVKIAGDAYRTYHEKTNLEPQIVRRKPEPFVPAARFQAETTTNLLTGFESRVQGQHALAPRSLPRSHSPHALHNLFKQ